MFDLNPLTAISREIREWTMKIEQGDVRRDQETINALNSLSTAVLETRSYLGQISSGKKARDLDKERALSALWNKAHMDLRLVDPALADRCFVKAEYWADPSSWDDQKFRQYDIALDSMSDAVRGILVKSHRR